MANGNEGQGHQVKITIDKKDYESPSHTTGQALYALGGIDPNVFNLFMEEKGDDKLIPNNGVELEVEKGDVFYSVKKQLNPGSHE